MKENADKQNDDGENVEGDERIETSGADKPDAEKESPSKKSKASPSTPSKQGSLPSAKTINVTPEVTALSEQVVAETAAANSSIVGGALGGGFITPIHRHRQIVIHKFVTLQRLTIIITTDKR